VIRKVNPEDKSKAKSTPEQEIIIQRKIAHGSLQFLDEKYGEERNLNEHLGILYEKLKIDLNFFNQEVEEINTEKGDPLKNFQSIYLQLLEQQRDILNQMNHSTDYDEEVIRKYFSLIDLEEFKIREKLL
jgi:CPA1 family monovalent cation:H+ antiporter